MSIGDAQLPELVTGALGDVISQSKSSDQLLVIIDSVLRGHTTAEPEWAEDQSALIDGLQLLKRPDSHVDHVYLPVENRPG
ncbi:hypothetical protein Airi01_088540 [Actinoallomurus iriomotensis]|uniref:Uncharacterized protein n=1 Tax=Actinoallomurus iriomotensis TaxID=478107 RepID=A0A9W6VVH9_9ACTN|nr:hypothetical protein Airi01_088540 [Actinoallomurus iriomotensis]